MEALEKERRRWHVHCEEDPDSGYDVSNADLPGRKNGRSVCMRMPAPVYPAGITPAEAIMPGSVEAAGLFIFRPIRKQNAAEKYEKKKEGY